MCIDGDEWAAESGSVPGSGSGWLIEVGGVWYFFDGSPSPCGSVVRHALIDWETAVRADECPAATGCGRDIVITWTGSVTYTGLCCGDPAYWQSTWTGTQSAKNSPTFSLGCDDEQGTTAMEDVASGGVSCPSGVAPISDAKHRLLFRIARDETACQWVITVQGSGTAPSYCCNDAGGTGWSLQFRAPLSACPPADGWTLVASTEPLIGVDCFECGGQIDATVTTFDAGTVTVALL